MKVPRLDGEIERRLLINFRMDPADAAALLPAPFRPHLVNGYAVAGICMIRLGAMRPRGMPRRIGVRSENAAHRFAVEWDTADGPRTGVFIPRRDTDSLVNAAVGGRLFPGAHHRASFTVEESPSALSVGFVARDGSAQVSAVVDVCDELVGSKLFTDLDEASAFFEAGSTGFSNTRNPARFDGLELATAAWRIEPGEMVSVHSSYFADEALFPHGTPEFDSVLVMRKVPVSWKPLASLSASAAS